MNKTISDNELARYWREEAAIYAACALDNARTWRERFDELKQMCHTGATRVADISQTVVAMHWAEHEARFEIQHAKLLLAQARILEAAAR